MTKTNIFFIAIATTLLSSCDNNNSGNAQIKKHFPKPGTTVAEAQIPVTDDALNHFVYSVKVIADSDIAEGVYDVDVDYGPNFAEDKFTMPKGIEDIRPVIRNGGNPNTFIIGFRLPNDTTFNDYFQVEATKHTTKMVYIKAYSF